MRLIYDEWDFEIDLKENVVNSIVIENTNIFNQMTESLWNQVNGFDGKWILSEEDKILSITKSVVCIINPYSIDYNDKKLLTSLHKEIVSIANEQYFDEVAEINTNIINLIDNLISKEPYGFDMKMELDISGLLKLYDLKLEIDGNDLLSRIIGYIKLAHKISGVDIFTFVNIKSYLDSEQILMLYEESFYEKVKLILLDSFQYEKNKYEKVMIIDKDRCIICIDE